MQFNNFQIQFKHNVPHSVQQVSRRFSAGQIKKFIRFILTEYIVFI